MASHVTKLKVASKIMALANLFRGFETSLLAGTAAFITIILGVTNPFILVVLSLATWMTSAGTVSWNDSLDLKEDHISHPQRPIPSGHVSVGEARLLGTTLVVIGMAMASFVSMMASMLTLTIFLIALAYSRVAKGQFMAKNLTVSLTTLFSLLLAPYLLDVQPSAEYPLVAASITLLLSGYEILKDLRDVAGDAAAGIDTLPLRTSPRLASLVAAVFFILSCLIMVGVFWVTGMELEALISVAATFGLLPPLSYLYQDPTPERAEKSKYMVIFILGLALSLVGASMYLKVTVL